MNSMQTCKSVTFYFMKNSFSDVSRKWILPNMISAVPLPANVRKWVFHEIKHDRITNLLGIHVWVFNFLGAFCFFGIKQLRNWCLEIRRLDVEACHKWKCHEQRRAPNCSLLTMTCFGLGVATPDLTPPFADELLWNSISICCVCPTCHRVVVILVSVYRLQWLMP